MSDGVARCIYCFYPSKPAEVQQRTDKTSFVMCWYGQPVNGDLRPYRVDQSIRISQRCNYQPSLEAWITLASSK